MKDPYEVLGIPRTATDEEVKAAYRTMAKKYHPDNYTNSPLGDVAEQKMKEINEAYDTITEERKNAASGRSGGYTGYAGAGGYGGYSNSSYGNIRSLIMNGRIHDADELLEAVPSQQRGAEWYYLKGCVFVKKGWTNEAYTCFRKAVSMDPSNPEYREALNRMNYQRQNPTGGYNTQNTNAGDCTFCDICNAMMCANCCCNCMGRGC